jgi:hypothetical protein
MRRVITSFAAVVVLVPAIAIAADQRVESMPGYFPLEEMGLFEAANLEADVDLTGTTLQMVAGAAEEKDPDLAELVSQMERIRVRVGPIEAADEAAATAEFDRAIATLEGAGWTAILSVNAQDAMIRVYTREQNDEIVGMTVLVNADNEDAVLVNIVGRLDPRLIGRMIARMDDLPDLDELGIDLEAHSSN